MKFIVDENVRKSVVVWLRAQEYDVLYIAESHSQMIDKEILKKAVQQHRILITNDTDFGELIFRQKMKHYGVILFRLNNEARLCFVTRLEELLQMYSGKLENNFVVISENQIRFRQ